MPIYTTTYYCEQLSKTSRLNSEINLNDWLRSRFQSTLFSRMNFKIITTIFCEKFQFNILSLFQPSFHRIHIRVSADARRTYPYHVFFLFHFQLLNYFWRKFLYFPMLIQQFSDKKDHLASVEQQHVWKIYLNMYLWRCTCIHIYVPEYYACFIGRFINFYQAPISRLEFFLRTR